MTSFLIFLAGAFAGVLLEGINRRTGGWPEKTPEKVPGPPTPAPSSSERSVYIPGRNFEEMLQRLGPGQSMLDLVLDSMGEGVLLLNHAGRVVLMNPSAERILGQFQKDSLGKHYLEVVRHPYLAELLERSKGRSGIASGEFELPGKEEKAFSISVAAVQIEDGPQLGQVVVISDITSLKKLMAMRTEFVANVSHELKTPLTAIMGYVETLLSGALDDKKNRVQFLQKISDQAQRLHALIKDVLELSRIESGASLEKTGPVDLYETASTAMEMLKAKAESRNVRVVLEVPQGTFVEGLPEGMLHVAENLLDNAVKYSPAGGEVRVVSRVVEGGRTEFIVSDQGPGIPVEFRERVFERFFRVDPSRSREAGGTGLGLSIVKHLVERMSGEVKLENGPIKGSVFTVTLPTAGDDPSTK